MKIAKFSDFKTIGMPQKHFNMCGGPRLDTEAFSIGQSYYLPGGGSDEMISDREYFYLLLEGELTVTVGSGEEVVLGAGDICLFERGEPRRVINNSNSVANLFVVTAK